MRNNRYPYNMEVSVSEQHMHADYLPHMESVELYTTEHSAKASVIIDLART